jgi:hypothetical protein
MGHNSRTDAFFGQDEQTKEYPMRQLVRIALIEIVVGTVLSACAPIQTPTATPIPQDAISSIDAYLDNLAREGAFSRRSYRWDRSFYTEELGPQELLDTIFTPFISILCLPCAPPYDQASYGYGWFVGERLGHRVVGHGGTYNGFRALIERYPDDEILIVILSNLESSDITVTTFPAETIFGEG